MIFIPCFQIIDESVEKSKDVKPSEDYAHFWNNVSIFKLKNQKELKVGPYPILVSNYSETLFTKKFLVDDIDISGSVINSNRLFKI